MTSSRGRIPRMVILFLLMLCQTIGGFSIRPKYYIGGGVAPVSMASQPAAFDDDDNHYEEPPMELPGLEEEEEKGGQSALLDESELQSWTVHQLKQQLRLRGQPVSGRKAELVSRLYKSLHPNLMVAQLLEKEEEESRQFAKQQNKELVDVSDYLDADEQGQSVKSSAGTSGNNDNEEKEDSSSPEVWGAEARLSLPDDVQDHRIIVDALSRTELEFKGSNQSYVKATMIATRDALQPYLRGGSTNATNPSTIAAATERRLYELQQEREQAAAKPIRPEEDQIGADQGDEDGLFDNVLNREVADWGKYTVTGAQLSAEEIQGVLLLTDVYGIDNDDTLALAEKIAFECQPVIVMIPDLFRGRPWKGPTDSKVDGQTYEEWRSSHSDLRVNVDIRAAAACLRETYGVSSVVLWGLCYGGGRALEAASGWMPSVHDIDGVTVGPPPVEPASVVVWYPTRYNAGHLFGDSHQGQTSAIDGNPLKMAVMAVFGEKDSIRGATPADALVLKEQLEEDERVIDHMVKVFPNQDHGFAHQGLSRLQGASEDEIERFVDEEFGGAGRLAFADGDAEVACLLSTAFMETYSRVFLPTVGPPISKDDPEWGQKLFLKELQSSSERNIRDELRDSLDNFVEEPLQSGPLIDPTDASQEERLATLLRTMEPPDQEGPFKIEDDDNLATIYAKLTTVDKDFQIF